METIIFPKLFETIKDGYHPDRVAVIKGRLERQEEEIKILAEQVRWL